MRRPTHSRVASLTLALVTALSLAACGGDDATNPGNGGGGGGGGGNVPAALVGEWNYGAISPTNFWNDHTGQYAGNAYGVGAWFTFASDGSFDLFVYQYVQNYNCTTQIWTRMRGPMDESNGIIALYPTKGDYKVADNCIASHNYKRAMTSSELADKQGEQWAWEFAVNPNDNKTYLMLGWAGSGQSYYFQPVP